MQSHLLVGKGRIQLLLLRILAAHGRVAGLALGIPLGPLLGELQQLGILLLDASLQLRHLAHGSVALGAHAIDDGLHIGYASTSVADLLRKVLDLKGRVDID